MLRNFNRQHPLLQVQDFCRFNYARDRMNHRKKLLCLETKRGRSVVSIARRSRLQFRQLLINHQLYGFQPDSW